MQKQLPHGSHSSHTCTWNYKPLPLPSFYLPTFFLLPPPLFFSPSLKTQYHPPYLLLPDFLSLLFQELCRYSSDGFLSRCQQLPQLLHEDTCILSVKETSQIHLQFTRIRKLAHGRIEKEKMEGRQKRGKGDQRSERRERGGVKARECPLTCFFSSILKMNSTTTSSSTPNSCVTRCVIHGLMVFKFTLLISTFTDNRTLR